MGAARASRSFLATARITRTPPTWPRATLSDASTTSSRCVRRLQSSPRCQGSRHRGQGLRQRGSGSARFGGAVHTRDVALHSRARLGRDFFLKAQLDSQDRLIQMCAAYELMELSKLDRECAAFLVREACGVIPVRPAVELTYRFSRWSEYLNTWARRCGTAIAWDCVRRKPRTKAH